MIKSFLLVGQSNMAGRGFIGEVEPIQSERIVTLVNGIWRVMWEPLNYDRAFSGVNLAASFAEDYIRDNNHTVIGLIPCADGGSKIEAWQRGEPLYDNAVFQAKLAIRNSDFSGILWHQGESNCDNPEVYEAKLRAVIDCFREDLGDVPFILGGLGDYLINYENENMKNYSLINDIMQKIATDKENCAYVSSNGLTSNPDNLHFNAKSLREFGHRYYKIYTQMSKSLNNNINSTIFMHNKDSMENL